MPKFVIERETPVPANCRRPSFRRYRRSRAGSCAMGPRIQWVQSYVTDDKIYCVYVAPDAETVREHARQGGFPADAVAQVRTVIDPTTAE